MKYLTLLIALIPFISFASTGLESCGDYSFKGIPKIQDKEIIIVINEGTLSEFKFIVPLNEHFKVTPYLKLMAEGEFFISKIHHQWKGEVINLKDVKLSVPDPLNPEKHSFLNFKKGSACK